MPERWPKTARDAWAAGTNTRLANYIYMVISLTTAFRRYSRVHFGVTCVGEFSNDIMIVVFFKRCRRVHGCHLRWQLLGLGEFNAMD